MENSKSMDGSKFIEINVYPRQDSARLNMSPLRPGEKRDF